MRLAVVDRRDGLGSTRKLQPLSSFEDLGDVHLPRCFCSAFRFLVRHFFAVPPETFNDLGANCELATAVLFPVFPLALEMRPVWPLALSEPLTFIVLE